MPIISFHHRSRPQITFAISFQVDVLSYSNGGPAALARLN
jgi:hypothetical protein